MSTTTTTKAPWQKANAKSIAADELKILDDRKIATSDNSKENFVCPALFPFSIMEKKEEEPQPCEEGSLDIMINRFHNDTFQNSTKKRKSSTIKTFQPEKKPKGIEINHTYRDSVPSDVKDGIYIIHGHKKDILTTEIVPNCKYEVAQLHELFFHQKVAMLWIIWSLILTYDAPFGGKFLWDETGLGKTITAIASLYELKKLQIRWKKSVLTDRCESKWSLPPNYKPPPFKLSSFKTMNDLIPLEKEIQKLTPFGFPFRSNRPGDGLGPLRILIVVPNGLLEHTWENDVRQMFGDTWGERSLKWVGPKRKSKAMLEELNHADWVYTTYDVLVKEFQLISKKPKVSSPIFEIEWDKVILDEAALIRNAYRKRRLLRALAVKQLKVHRHLLMTAVPISREADNILSYMAVIGHPEGKTRNYFENVEESKLEELRDNFVIRRTIDDLKLWPKRKRVQFIYPVCGAQQSKCIQFMLKCYKMYQKEIKDKLTLQTDEHHLVSGIWLSLTRYEMSAGCVGTTGIYRLYNKAKDEYKKEQKPDKTVDEKIIPIIRNFWTKIIEMIEEEFPFVKTEKQESRKIQNDDAVKFFCLLRLISAIRSQSEDRIVIFSDSVLALNEFIVYVRQQCTSLPFAHLNWNPTFGDVPIVKGGESKKEQTNNRSDVIREFNNQRGRLAWHIKQLITTEHCLTYESNKQPEQLAQEWIQSREMNDKYEIEPQKYLNDRICVLIHKQLKKRETLLLDASNGYCPMRIFKVIESFLLEESELAPSQFQNHISFLEECFNRIEKNEMVWFMEEENAIWQNSEWIPFLSTTTKPILNVNVFIQSLLLLYENQCEHPGSILLQKSLKEKMTEQWKKATLVKMPFLVLWYMCLFVNLSDEDLHKSLFFITERLRTKSLVYSTEILFHLIPILQEQFYDKPNATFKKENALNPKEIYNLLSNSQNSHGALFIDSFYRKILPSSDPTLNLTEVLSSISKIGKKSEYVPDYYKHYGFKVSSLQESIICVSGKYGCAGLNFISANIVVQMDSKLTFYDCLQPIGRELRIGQCASVYPYRILLQNRKEDQTILGELSQDQYNFQKYEVPKLRKSLDALPHPDNPKMYRDYCGPYFVDNPTFLDEYERLRGLHLKDIQKFKESDIKKRKQKYKEHVEMEEEEDEEEEQEEQQQQKVKKKKQQQHMSESVEQQMEKEKRRNMQRYFPKFI